MTDRDPWAGMTDGSSTHLFARRIPTAHEDAGVSEFWTLKNGEVGLMLEYPPDESTAIMAPSFRGIRIGENRAEHSIIIELADPSMRDAFLAVCEDIVEQLDKVQPVHARRAFILRLQRWGILFRGEHQTLSSEAQKGLIGELQCLDRIVIPYCGPSNALAAWTGPEHGVHDFTLGASAIEVKTNRGAGTPKVTISSENQLAVGAGERLHLYAMGVVPSLDAGMTLPEYVEDTRRRFESPIDGMKFDLKLAQIGYAGPDGYDTRWVVGTPGVYRIVEGFPRITSDTLDPAVSDVTYRVDLSHCGEYRIDEHTLVEELEGINGR